MIHNGVSHQHKKFWQAMETDGLLLLYQAQAISPAMVLKMLEDNNPLNSGKDIELPSSVCWKHDYGRTPICHR